jgi:hypothetical protein
MMASVPNRSGPRQEHDAAHSKDGLGGLVGAGPSKVGVDGAMRARDVARPSAQDLEEAERDLLIRHAAPRTDSRPLPHGITPSPVTPVRGAGQSDKPRPKPHPPEQAHPKDQPGNGGSTPEAS